MKILSSLQIKKLDQYTIKHEPIASIDLMERASLTFVNAFVNRFNPTKNIHIFCGPGNNGGDGLAVGRLLKEKDCNVYIHLLQFTENYSADYLTNLKRLTSTDISVHTYKSIDDLTSLTLDGIIIDAIFGSGLNKAIQNIGFLGNVVQFINYSELPAISIDIPSGVFADQTTSGTAIEADYVYSFQFPKLAFMMPENNRYIKEWEFLDIGLSQIGTEQVETSHDYLTIEIIKSIYKTRDKFSHKGSHGHMLLVAGSKGKAGAAILAAKSALRSGVGLLSIYTIDAIIPIIQETIPEAMCLISTMETLIESLNKHKTYTTIAIGPGLGTEKETVDLFASLLSNYKSPLVIDADGLNIISENNNLLERLPKNSILTPHPGEFKRLVGAWKNDFERLALQKSFSKKHKIVVVLKGAHTSISDIDGNISFNSTGNNGMATAGSGDTLTGIIAGLLTQGYTSINAAKLGVFLHGLAGDLALEIQHENSLIASDITEHLGKAFKQIEQ